MSEWTRREEEDERWKEDARGAGAGTKGVDDGRVARTVADWSETEEGTSEKESRSLALAWGRVAGCRERVDKGQHAGRK